MGRIAGPEKRVLHFQNNALEACADDFDVDGIELLCEHVQALLMSMMRFLYSSTTAFLPGKITVVQSS